MPHIFISYAKKDTRELALSLADALNDIEGITAWVDRSLRAGRSWELQIQAEIDRCETMIVLYSPDINRHKRGESESYVLTEIAYAKYTARKPIIPVMAQPTDPPISLTMEHYIDFTLDGLTLDDLVSALCDELEIDRQPESVVVPVRPAPTGTLTGRNIYDIMPAPFDLIDIPAGKVTLINNWDHDGAVYLKKSQPREFDVSAFAIAKYPVTNAQFAKFIDARGYKENTWWTPVGWRAKEDAGWTKPRYWQDTIWNNDEQPVVGVSWYEAMAFCHWLSEVSVETIVLPSEKQWQRAAQGDDGRAWPWGGTWDCQRCNNSVAPCNYDTTTLVNQYEGQIKGDSPFGVVDMAGNVWEWCRTAYYSGENDLDGTDGRVVLRGASWFNDSKDNFRVDFRNWDNAPSRNSRRGFRFSTFAF